MRQMMHEPSHAPLPPTAAPEHAVVAAAAADDGDGVAAEWAGLQACLWPPCFQWTFWHAAEQYITLLHRAHRCKPLLAHPPLPHSGTSSALPLLPPSLLPVHDIVVVRSVSSALHCTESCPTGSVGESCVGGPSSYVVHVDHGQAAVWQTI